MTNRSPDIDLLGLKEDRPMAICQDRAAAEKMLERIGFRPIEGSRYYETKKVYAFMLEYPNFTEVCYRTKAKVAA